MAWIEAHHNASGGTEGIEQGDLARVFDELCGVDDPGEQAALVRAAFPVATT